MLFAPGHWHGKLYADDMFEVATVSLPDPQHAQWSLSPARNGGLSRKNPIKLISENCLAVQHPCPPSTSSGDLSGPAHIRRNLATSRDAQSWNMLEPFVDLEASNHHWSPNRRFVRPSCGQTLDELNICCFFLNTFLSYMIYDSCIWYMLILHLAFIQVVRTPVGTGKRIRSRRWCADAQSFGASWWLNNVGVYTLED